MINFTLLINGNEVDLNDKVSIALTKTYESLEDPTKIFTDFSKTVNIPMTSRNNIIFESAFRPDQVVTTGGLDPRKKVPFILLNNQTLIMTGYAKVIETASNSPKDRSYSVTLYSKMGELFNELKQMTFAPTTNNKYTLNNPLPSTCHIDRNLVKNSFEQETHNLDLESKTTLDYIGFMPTYQGKYDDFQSDKLEALDGKVVWVDSPEDAEGNVLDEGVEVDEHYRSEYRSYYQQPFIYVDALWQLLKQKVEQVTDYKMELDPSWFNPQNPYYRDLILTMPSLYNKESVSNAANQVQKFDYAWNSCISNTSRSQDLSNNHKKIINFTPKYLSGVQIYDRYLNRFDAKGKSVHFKAQFLYTLFAANFDQHYTDGYAKLRDANHLFLEFRAVDAQTMEYIPGAVNKFMFYSNSTEYKHEGVTKIDLGITSRNTPEYVTSPEPGIVTTQNGYGWAGKLSVEFDVVWQKPFLIIANQYAANNGDPFEKYDTMLPQSWIPKWSWAWPDFYQVNNNTVNGHTWYLTTISAEAQVTETQRSNSALTMNRIWSLEKTPFEYLLDYAKMFRLVFDLDNDNKVLRVMDRNRYFQNYTIEDWTDKLDKSKEFKIKPINFENKYLDFKYSEGNGGVMKTYQDKYGANYGSYKVDTGYDFNADSTDLFTEVMPSVIATKKQNSGMFNTLHPKRPNYRGKEYRYFPNEYFPDNDAEGRNAGNAGQFFFRNGTYEVDPTISYSSTDHTYRILISDDTDYQVVQNEYMWTILGSRVTTTNKLPAISTYTQDGKYSIHFAKPKELYFNRSMIEVRDDSFIYNKFWQKYLNDRYSVQSKVVTSYFYLTPNDWMNYKFNKFVLVDNVLYMVNKISDFDLTTDRSTKVELVQVNDIASYAETDVKFPYLYAEHDTITVNSGASTSTRIYSSSNWSLFSVPNWVYAVKNGDFIEVYLYNLDYDNTAEGYIVLRNTEGLQYTLTVINNYSGQLIPSTNYMSFGYNGGTKHCYVNSASTQPTVASKPTWIEAEFTMATRSAARWLNQMPTEREINEYEVENLRDSQVVLNVVAQRNRSNSARSGYITISNGSGSCIIRVSQRGNSNVNPVFPVDPNSVDEVARLELPAGEASTVDLATNKQVNFLSLGISNGLTDSQGALVIGETAFRVQPAISANHTHSSNAGVDGGFIKLTTVDGENIFWPYNTVTIPTYDVYIYSEDNNGHVTVNGTDGNYLANHDTGDILTISATPETGYTFAGWSDGDTNASRTITVGTENINLYASFALQIINRSITYSLTDVISSNSAVSIVDGNRYTTTLTPVSGYSISTVRVMMGGVDITSTAYNGGVVTIDSVTGNVAITATAALIPSEWNYEWDARDGKAPLNFENFRDGDISQCIPDQGGRFINFNGMKVWEHSSAPARDYYLPDGCDMLEVEAEFAVKRSDGHFPFIHLCESGNAKGINMVFDSANCIMRYNDEGNWKDSRVSLDANRVGLQKVYLKFDVDDSYKRVIQIGNLFKLSDEMSEDLGVVGHNGIFTNSVNTAWFMRSLKVKWRVASQQTVTYTASVSTSNGGTVSVDGVTGNYSQTVNAGTMLSIRAVPNSGYVFSRWSDNNTSANRSITVNNDVSLTAYFAVDPDYQLYYESSNSATITPTNANFGGASVVSNTYSGGGYLTFDIPLEEVGDSAFSGCSTMTAVSLPANVKVIGPNAFNGTSITSISLPAALTEIDDEAFTDTDLTTVAIGKDVAVIGINPFVGCTDLTSIKVNANNPYYDSRNKCNCIVDTNNNRIISGCYNSTVEDDIMAIGVSAFSKSKISKMKFGRSLVKIEGDAFSGCTQLAELTFTSPIPPTLAANVFLGLPTNGKLYCPVGTSRDYNFMLNELPSGWSVIEV